MFGSTWNASVAPDASDMTTAFEVVFTLTTVPVDVVTMAGTLVARETVGVGAVNVLAGDGTAVEVGDEGAFVVKVGMGAPDAVGVMGAVGVIAGLGDGAAVVVPVAVDWGVAAFDLEIGLGEEADVVECSPAGVTKGWM